MGQLYKSGFSILGNHVAGGIGGIKAEIWTPPQPESTFIAWGLAENDIVMGCVSLDDYTNMTVGWMYSSNFPEKTPRSFIIDSASALAYCGAHPWNSKKTYEIIAEDYIINAEGKNTTSSMMKYFINGSAVGYDIIPARGANSWWGTWETFVLEGTWHLMCGLFDGVTLAYGGIKDINVQFLANKTAIEAEYSKLIQQTIAYTETNAAKMSMAQKVEYARVIGEMAAKMEMKTHVAPHWSMREYIPTIVEKLSERARSEPPPGVIDTYVNLLTEAMTAYTNLRGVKTQMEWPFNRVFTEPIPDKLLANLRKTHGYTAYPSFTDRTAAIYELLNPVNFGKIVDYIGVVPWKDTSYFVGAKLYTEVSVPSLPFNLKRMAAKFENITISRCHPTTYSGGAVVSATNTSFITHSANWLESPTGNHNTNTTGATLEVTWTGDSIYWFGSKGPNMGKATVLVDDMLPITVDLYNLSAGSSSVIWSSRLAYGTHHLTITCSGTKNVSSSGYYINVDHFIIDNISKACYWEDLPWSAYTWTKTDTLP